MTQVVAERLIYGTVDGFELEVIVRVWTPERADDGHARCRFTFHSNRADTPLRDGEGNGVDQMQALIEALHGIGWTLDESNIEWSMFPEQQPGADDARPVREDGFPRAGLSVMFLGAAFRKRIESYVECEKIEALKSSSKPRRPPILPSA